MYHKASIDSLSPSQISKALKGLPVRVSVGNQHDIELSQEQLKKFSKAGQKGKAATISLDPYQIQNHMHLQGAGKLKKSIREDAARLVSAGTDRAIQEIEGGSVNRLKKAGRWEHFANATIRDGIDTAGKAARVYKKSTDPMSMLGFGLKKRGRPRKTGGALYVAGSQN